MIQKEKFTTPGGTWYALAKDSAGTMPQIWLYVPESVAESEVMFMRTVAPAGHPVEEYQGTITVERSETELILTSKITGTGPTETVLEDMSSVEQLIGELASYSHAAKLDKTMSLEGSDIYWKTSALKDKLDSLLAPQHGPIEPFAEITITDKRRKHKAHRIGYEIQGRTLWLIEPYKTGQEYHPSDTALVDQTGRVIRLFEKPADGRRVVPEMLPTALTSEERIRFVELLSEIEQLDTSWKTIYSVTAKEQLNVSKALVTIRKRIMILGQKAFDMLAPKEQ